MSVDIMSEADTKFIADNMLTADDFDLSESLDISTLARLSQELQLYKQCLPGLDGEQPLKALSDLFHSEESLWESTPNALDHKYDEITRDFNYNLECDREIKVELCSPNPSPGSTSGYSSHGSWNEEYMVTEIEVPESDVSESPPDSPPAIGHLPGPSTSSVPLVSNGCTSIPLTIPNQPLVLNSVQVTSVHKATKVPLQKTKPAIREIQPKAIKRKLQLCSPDGRSQSVILTPEEFSQLAVTSLALQQQQQQQQTILVSTPVVQQQQEQRPRTTDSTRKSSLPFNFKPDAPQATTKDVKAIKRQQRMIRNRESAFLSRKKRREYVQNLEQHLSDLSQEKGRLLAENSQLKEKIKCLENENKKLKTIFPTATLKKTTCLMGLLFMVALNVTPFSGLLSGNSFVQKSPVSSVNRYGRNLLWTPERKDSDSLPISLEEDLQQKIHHFKTPSLKNLTSSCPTYVNKTEALRLEKELRGWAMRVEKQKQKQKPSLQKLRKKLQIPMPRLHTLFQTRAQHQQQQHSINVVHKDLEVYSAPRSVYEDLFDALERRDDTFYFVSFSGDHLLLPASAHNRTQRPKMALVMPAMTLNETTKENQVTMMQIDCEVMNMHFVEVKETAIPLHLRHKLVYATQPHDTSRNTTTRPSPKMQQQHPFKEPSNT